MLVRARAHPITERRLAGPVAQVGETALHGKRKDIYVIPESLESRSYPPFHALDPPHTAREETGSTAQSARTCANRCRLSS
jgi:hypothetical protein